MALLWKSCKRNKPLFHNDEGSCYFPPRKSGLPMVQERDFPTKKSLSTSQSGCFELPSPPPESVRSGGSTPTSQPKFVGWIDNQIFLATGLHSRALRGRLELRYKQVNAPITVKWHARNCTSKLNVAHRLLCLPSRLKQQGFKSTLLLDP